MINLELSGVYPSPLLCDNIDRCPGHDRSLAVCIFDHRPKCFWDQDCLGFGEAARLLSWGITSTKKNQLSIMS